LARSVPDGVTVIFVESDEAAAEPYLDGDRLMLAVPEAYEHLPRKTHAFFRWACENTACEHVVKCDDDSYLDLDVASGFDFRGADYAGRLTPPRLGVVETWHFGRCLDARFEVPFKGPFPDLYAEGFGYVVSRKAAACVARAGESDLSRHVLEDVFVGWCIANARESLGRMDLSAGVCARRTVLTARDGVLVRHPLQPDGMFEAHRRFAGRRLADRRSRSGLVGRDLVACRPAGAGTLVLEAEQSDRPPMEVQRCPATRGS
jgi:hypothetical protein